MYILKEKVVYLRTICELYITWWISKMYLFLHFRNGSNGHLIMKTTAFLLWSFYVVDRPLGLESIQNWILLQHWITLKIEFKCIKFTEFPCIFLLFIPDSTWLEFKFLYWNLTWFWIYHISVHHWGLVAGISIPLVYSVFLST